MRMRCELKNKKPIKWKKGWIEWWMTIPEKLEQVPLWIRAVIGFVLMSFVAGWMFGGLDKTNKLYDWQ